MTVPGNSYPVELLGAQSQPVLPQAVTLQFTDNTDEPGGGAGGLALTGWTEDASNPANAATHGAVDGSTGRLTFGAPGGTTQAVIIDASEVAGFNGDGSFAAGFGTGATAADAEFTTGAGVPIGFYGVSSVVQATVTGSLTTVIDPAVQAILTSLIAALSATAGIGVFIDGTT